MQKKINRGIVYVAGLLLLAMGIILNTKTGLGVSPIISVAYSVSVISGMNLGNMTLILYSIFVLIEMILHTIRRKKGEYVKRLFLDILQIPLSIVFTRFMNLFCKLCSGVCQRLCRYFLGQRSGTFDAFDTGNHIDRCRSRNVFKYAYHTKSGRWNCTGNCRLYRKVGRIYQKLL